MIIDFSSRPPVAAQSMKILCGPASASSRLVVQRWLPCAAAKAESARAGTSKVQRDVVRGDDIGITSARGRVAACRGLSPSA